MSLKIMSTFKLQTSLLWLCFFIIIIDCQTNQYIEEIGPNGEDIWKSTSDFIPVQSQSFGTITIGRHMLMEFDFIFWGRNNDPSEHKYEQFFRVGFDGSYGNGCDGQGARYPSFWLTKDVDTMHLSVSNGETCQPAQSLGEYGNITIGTTYHVYIEFNDTLLIAEVSEPNMSNKTKWRQEWNRTSVDEQYIGQTAPIWWMSNKYSGVPYNRGNGTFWNVTIISYDHDRNWTSTSTAVPTTTSSTEDSSVTSTTMTTSETITASPTTSESTITSTNTTTDTMTTSVPTTSATELIRNTATESTDTTTTSLDITTSQSIHTSQSSVQPRHSQLFYETIPDDITTESDTNSSKESSVISKKTKITFNLPFNLVWLLVILILSCICIVCCCFAIWFYYQTKHINDHETKQSKEEHVAITIAPEMAETDHSTDDSTDNDEEDEDMKTEEIPKQTATRKGTDTGTHTIGNNTMMNTIEIVNHPSKLFEDTESIDSNMYSTYTANSGSIDSMHHRSGAMRDKPSEFRTMILNEDIDDYDQTDDTEDTQDTEDTSSRTSDDDTGHDKTFKRVSHV